MKFHHGDHGVHRVFIIFPWFSVISVISVVSFEKLWKMQEPMLIEEALTEQIIGAAIEVHRCLGPGLLESAYQHCLAHELTLRKIPFEIEKPLPIGYKGFHLDCGYRLDLVVDGKVVVEVKSVQSLQPIHEAQVLTYLKLSGYKVGLLINFNVMVLKHGIHRLAL